MKKMLWLAAVAVLTLSIPTAVLADGNPTGGGKPPNKAAVRNQ
jgi:hypothetical protein